MRSRRSTVLGLVLGLVMLGVMPWLSASALAPGTNAFERTWSRTDEPVASYGVTRTWMWGPEAFSAVMWEPYAESPDDQRQVQYFDKSRMEITNPGGDQNSIWYVTNGLIANELITGRMQLGDNTFADLQPAQVNVAGDPGDTQGPTYATFRAVLNVTLGPPNEVIVNRIDRAGNVTADPSMAQYGVTAQEYVVETNHRVASVFWAFMTSSGMVLENDQLVSDAIFENPYFGTGLPITEAYWARVEVGGTAKDVLVQCFERRCLTYTPSNDPLWRVEMGNVGRHYYEWRYHTQPPVNPPAISFSDYLSLGPAPLVDWPVDEGGQSWLWIGNQSPYPMTVQLDGPVSQTLNLPNCNLTDCIVYPDESWFVTCLEGIPTTEVVLPPGNYRVTITYSEGNVTPGAGYWTLVPDADYASCYAVIESFQNNALRAGP